MSGQHHISAALLLVSTGYAAAWAPEPVWKQWRRERLPPLPPPGNEPRSSSSLRNPGS